MRVLIACDDKPMGQMLLTSLISNDVDTLPVSLSPGAIRDRADHDGPFDLIFLNWDRSVSEGAREIMDDLAGSGFYSMAFFFGRTPRPLDMPTGESTLGRVARSEPPWRLVAAACRVLAATSEPDPIRRADAADRAQRIGLTRREVEALQGLGAGMSNKEIARDHGLQEVTVKLHVKTLSRKLGARNRTHAAMIGRDMNLI